MFVIYTVQKCAYKGKNMLTFLRCPNRKKTHQNSTYLLNFRIKVFFQWVNTKVVYNYLQLKGKRSVCCRQDLIKSLIIFVFDHLLAFEQIKHFLFAAVCTILKHCIQNVQRAAVDIIIVQGCCMWSLMQTEDLIANKILNRNIHDVLLQVYFLFFCVGWFKLQYMTFSSQWSYIAFQKF